MAPKGVRLTFLAVFIICGVVLSSRYYGYESANTVLKETMSPNGGLSNDPSSFEWSRLRPTEDLRWSPCFDQLECARLSVPMDHHNPNGKQGAIAIIRKVSPLGSDHADYRGPILFNPGGPGGSGVEFIKSYYKDMLAKVVGPQFDLVSFDPRGIGQSIPRASFFKSRFERLMSNVDLHFVHDEGVAKHWANRKVINAIALENDDGGLRYINTEQTARDMLSIVRAYGRDKLQYWGFSYGSILGATYAAMFPDKIERMVIDGVADSQAYYDNISVANLADAEKGLDIFVSSCHQAGPVACHFWAPTESNIRQNMTTLFDNVRRHPVSVAVPAGPHGVVDIDLLLGFTLQALYSPYALFPIMADAYAALAQGDGSVILNLSSDDTQQCPVEDSANPALDGQPTVICNDGPEIPNDLESTKQYLALAKKQSPLWGPLIGAVQMLCIDWPKFPKTHFKGPFNATTSFPLLLVGNTADPVTPLASAKKMSEGFTDSVVLTQDSGGHCSFNAPSVCTQSYIRRYFVDGKLPEHGTVCPTDTPIFADQSIIQGHDAQTTLSAMSAEEQDIYSAIQELSRKDVLNKFLSYRMLRGVF